MSQHNLPKNTPPILHRYDPTQVTIPPQVSAVTSAPSVAATPGKDPAGTTAGSPVANTPTAAPAAKLPATTDRPVEIGGPSGPEPTRYGDWERNGRVSDF